MSVCGPEEDSGSEEPCGPSGGPLRDMRRRKSPSKVLRLLTVLAYLLSVSLAAILLSIYYVYVWKSPQVPVEAEHRMGCRSHLRSGRKDCIRLYDILMKGGSNSTVKVNSTTGTSDTITTALTTTESVDEATTEPTASSLPTSTSLPSSPSQLPQARQSPQKNTSISTNT